MQNETIRVLVVDGDPHRADQLGDVLTTAGFEIRTVSDSVSAVGALEVWRPSVAVVDLRFPSAESHRFCAVVAERPEADSLPLVLVAEGPNLLKPVAVVPAGLVPTPVDPDQLVATILRVSRDAAGAWSASLSAR
jgi:DNA-binding response OmpR family regulator